MRGAVLCPCLCSLPQWQETDFFLQESNTSPKTASVGIVGYPSCHRDSTQTWATSMGPSMAAHTASSLRWQRLVVLGFPMGGGVRLHPHLAILRLKGCSCAGAFAENPSSGTLTWYRTMHGIKNNQHSCSVTLPCSKGFKNPLLSGLLNHLLDPLINPLVVCGDLPLFLWKENRLNTGKINTHWQ